MGNIISRAARAFPHARLPQREEFFRNVMMDNVMPDRIIPISDTATIFIYGSTAYTLSYDIGENGEKLNIRLQKEGV